jgi:tRNA(fMet)-specific endonuclease VapC
MIGYLMDTNHVSALAARNKSIMAKLAALPANTPIYASTITLGEIAAGHEMTVSTNQAKRNSAIAFVNSVFVPNALQVSHSTGAYYGKIIGRIWRNNQPASSNISTDKHLVSMNVGVNDVWIVALAWEHGLTLLTTDKMTCIKSQVSEVTWDNWC